MEEKIMLHEQVLFVHVLRKTKNIQNMIKRVILKRKELNAHIKKDLHLKNNMQTE